MTTFNKLQENENIQELIKTTFAADLPISGDWGYSQEKATVIESLPTGMPLKQLEHTLTTIRAHLEMNITQEKENRYGGINANEKSREVITEANTTFEKVSYEITAIKEDLYNAFIKEYKAGYESEELDLNEHFRRRKEATLVREVVHYFEGWLRKLSMSRRLPRPKRSLSSNPKAHTKRLSGSVVIGSGEKITMCGSMAIG